VVRRLAESTFPPAHERPARKNLGAAHDERELLESPSTPPAGKLLTSPWSERLYGLQILRRLEDGSRLTVPEGTVYPLLNRLRGLGWIEAEWVEGEAGHPRKYYRLTARGRRHALQMSRSWSTFASSLDRLLAPLRKEER
jgi:PadR family transcriptional regulator PadR